jgi:hypothetical protein
LIEFLLTGPAFTSQPEGESTDKIGVPIKESGIRVS